MLRKKIILQLNDKYTNNKDLRNATINELLKQGFICTACNESSTILINNEKYFLTDKIVDLSLFSVQRVILTKIN